jgi:hypothetical protein
VARIFKFVDMSGCELQTLNDPTSFRFPYTARKLPSGRIGCGLNQ